MFGGDNIYSLGIPLPESAIEQLQQLILSIADYKREPSYGVTKKLREQINVKTEFHITIGVFDKRDVFKKNKDLFKRLISELKQHRNLYAQMKSSMHGTCGIEKIGHSGSNIQDSDVVWATVASQEIIRLREQILGFLDLAKMNQKHFIFDHPHVTLFLKQGKDDVHGIDKRTGIELNKIIDHDINFKYDTVFFYQESNVVGVFGPGSATGKAKKNSFKNLLNAELKKRAPKVVYDWEALRNHEEYKKDAKRIEEIMDGLGGDGLAKAGYDVGKIMGIIRPKK